MRSVQGERRCAMTKYPNLSELLQYYPCGTGTVCDHAEIEPELLEAVLDGTEELTPVEIIRLSRLYRCPAGVLEHPAVLMLDMDRPKHKRMVQEVDCVYMQLMAMAGDGNLKAEQYLDLNRWMYQRFIWAVHEDRLSYCHYLGVKECFRNYVSWSMPAPKRRGPGRRAAG